MIFDVCSKFNIGHAHNIHFTKLKSDFWRVPKPRIHSFYLSLLHMHTDPCWLTRSPTFHVLHHLVSCERNWNQGKDDIDNRKYI